MSFQQFWWIFKSHESLSFTPKSCPSLLKQKGSYFFFDRSKSFNSFWFSSRVDDSTIFTDTSESKVFPLPRKADFSLLKQKWSYPFFNHSKSIGYFCFSSRDIPSTNPIDTEESWKSFPYLEKLILLLFFKYPRSKKAVIIPLTTPLQLILSDSHPEINLQQFW